MLSRLETENKALLGENNTLSESVKTLNGTIKTITEEKNGLNSSFEKLKTDYDGLINESSTEIQKLSEELSSVKSDNANSIVTKTILGKKYQVIGKKFNIPGRGEMTVQDILKEKEILEAMVRKGAGFLVPVE